MLSMCSDFIIPQDTAQTISMRGQVAFHPSRFVIGGNPDNWFVNNFKIGNAVQFEQVPGALFSLLSIDPLVRFGRVDVEACTVKITYTGAGPGERFLGTLFGSTAPSLFAQWTPEGRAVPW